MTMREFEDSQKRKAPGVDKLVLADWQALARKYGVKHKKRSSISEIYGKLFNTHPPLKALALAGVLTRNS
jgi:hypothetical protein